MVASRISSPSTVRLSVPHERPRVIGSFAALLSSVPRSFLSPWAILAGQIHSAGALVEVRRPLWMLAMLKHCVDLRCRGSSQ
jgi:hypothetical protein